MATVKKTPKITTTKNYRLFTRSNENRQLELKRHRKLKESIIKYGFLASFPVVCIRNGDNHLVVKDGQHRLAISEELGIPVSYVVEETDFDVAEINCTPKTWTLRDYAEKHAANGLKPYLDGLAFASDHKLPVGTAFALLAGTTTFGNCQHDFISGSFSVKDRKWADEVASLYCGMIELSKDLRNARFIEACMAVCRVNEFNQSRMLSCAKRCREKLVSYSNRDAFLQMLEEVYNFGRSKLHPLKIEAIQAMRKRNAAVVKSEAKAAKATRAAKAIQSPKTKATAEK